jgi:hypothetical protein
MLARVIIGLGLTVIAFAVAGRRVWWLGRLAFSGQPAPERVAYARSHPAREAETQLTEVIGQRKLLKWSVPGAAHAATFWGFIVLLLTIIEAYGALFSRTFAIPWIGHWAFIGFIEDLFAVGVLAGIVTFTVIRVRSNPHKEGRRSRFFGSHTRAAWVVLAMIAARSRTPARSPTRTPGRSRPGSSRRSCIPSATASTASSRRPSSSSSSPSSWPSW